MKRTLLIAALMPVLVFLSGPAGAQSRTAPGNGSGNRAVLKYDVNFEYDFNNREYDAGGRLYSPSFTTHAARLTPSVGFGLRQNNAVSHSVMAGIDIFKEMGASPGEEYGDKIQNLGLFKEITLWYSIEARLDRSLLKGWAGIFPRRFSVFGSPDTPLGTIPGRNIPSVFLSDRSRLYDNNIEGILLTSSRDRAYYELSLDWLGMQGNSRREQFKIQSYGKGMLLKWLSAGWATEIHHYANAFEYGHVLDNILLSPFIELDFNRILGTGFQELSLGAGCLGSIHRDRGEESSLRFSGGPRAVVTARKWNVGICNEFYLGGDLMPYYSCESPEGGIYGSNLYAGNPFYRIWGGKDGHSSTGRYDRLEAFWQPRIASFLDIRISAVAHFTQEGFQGWQQRLGLVFNLEKALSRSSSKASRESRMKEPGFFGQFIL